MLLYTRRMKSKRPRAAHAKSTAFVPRIVLKTVMASLTPAFATGCGNVIVLADAAFRNDEGVDRGVIVLADSAFRIDAPDTVQMGVAYSAFDGGADAAIDAGSDDVQEPTDTNIIVLAQIGFQVEPEATRDEQLASNTRTRRNATDTVRRRGRA